MNVPVDLAMIWIIVVVKRDDADIRNTNKFVVDEVHRRFYFAIPEGYMGVDQMIKGKADF